MIRQNAIDPAIFQGSTITKKEFNEATYDSLDYTDKETLDTVCSINEADRTAVLTSLTSKLYDSIVQKVDDIDFGSIAVSKGDITKVENYEQLLDTIQVLRSIVVEYHQDPEPIDVVIDAITNIRERAKTWMKCYQMNLGLPIITYQTMVLSCISSISLLIATSIEFIKSTGDDSYKVSLDKVAYNKTKDNLLYSNLKKFNEACDNGNIDTMIEHVIATNMKSFTGPGVVAIGATGVFLIIKVLIPMLRELVFFFYHARQSVSDYFAVQADLLQVNANNLQYRADITDSDREEIFGKQTSIADKFRKFSNVLSIKVKKAENDAHRTIDTEKRKYKISDLTDEKLDSAEVGLF